MPLLECGRNAASPRTMATGAPATPEKPAHQSQDEQQPEEWKDKGSRIPEWAMIKPGPGSIAGVGQTASQAGAIGGCPDHSGEHHCNQHQRDHHRNASVHDCLLSGATRSRSVGPMTRMTWACEGGMCGR